jgi:hypothetical protein
MAKPSNYPQPDLSRLTNRQMTISPYRGALEGELYLWVSDIVRQTGQPPADDGVPAEMYLMSTAQESIDVLMQAAPLANGMKLASGGAGGGGKQTVHADFHWLRRSDGRWVVDQVCFALAANSAANQLARQKAEKQALLDKAELRNARHVNARQAAFPVEHMPLQDFTQNVNFGNFLIETEIERAYEHAKEDGKLIENPVSEGWSMMGDLFGMGAGFLGGEKSAIEQLAGGNRADKLLDKSIKGLSHDEAFSYEMNNLSQILGEEGQAGAKRLATIAEQESQAFDLANMGKSMQSKEKSAGDKLIDAGLTLASFAAAGPWIKQIAGMMFDIAIASDAARVTKIRSRCYIFFVAGYIRQLTLSDTGGPVKKIDKKYFDLGMAAAPRPGAPGSLRVQLALLHYASEHYTDGGWGGYNYKRQNWHFPDDYITKWTPDLLGRSFATQLHKRKYLCE